MHSHIHHHASSQSKILIVFLLNAAITLAEFIGGLLSNSLALLSDAVHNLQDTLAIGISYGARALSRKPANTRFTFGYHRAEILSAFINMSILIVIAFFLVREAWERFQNPEIPVLSIMLPVAFIGLFGNALSIFFLKMDKDHSLNIRSAFLHLFYDTLSSVAVILAALGAWLWEWTWIDPAVTLVIAIFMIISSVKVLKSSLRILLNGTPEDLHLDEIVQKLETIDDITNIHHVHIWNISESTRAFCCEAIIDDQLLSKTSPIREKMLSLLKDYHIDHLTVQFETECDDERVIHT
ncbi:TPA: cation transporter [Candidatus Marinimicrobia bacterium]|nr:MAG: Cation diffusion facilitator family transporter [Marinimicrobia bacterium 46_47]KUK91242.1 MAG: cation diffusion facilitator family transporter [Marinimicrobia bacterium 46_43]HAE87356.1 cation transporter [Candidatus Neomarinimicrobiota bacterium]HBY18913.1 cation transporter [Candidatus Neomarinimicrobiota bacterium]